MKWLSYDSPLMQAISRATDYVILNFLCLVCSLPLVTAGAALSAKYYVGMKLLRGEEPAVVKAYFTSLSRNLKQALLPGIVSVLGGGVLLWDWWYALATESPAVYRWGLILITIVYMMIVFCFFVILSRYEIKTKEALKAALGMTGAHFGRLFLAVALFILPLIISIWYLKWAWLICAFVQCVMLHYSSMFFVKEFDRLEEKMGL